MTDAQKQALMSGLRSTAAVLCGIAIGRGWITTEQAEVIGGAAVAIVPAAWGVWRAFHNDHKIMVAVQSGAAAANAGSAATMRPDNITSDMAQAIIAVHSPEEKS